MNHSLLSSIALRGGLVLLALGLLWVLSAAAGADLWPVWGGGLCFALGAGAALWGVERQHRERVSTPEGRLSNVADRVQALCDFADGLGLCRILEVEVEQEDYDLVVDAAIEQGLIERPAFVQPEWRPDSLLVHGVVCRRASDRAPDDAELSGC